jgi:hypothetical protein
MRMAASAVARASRSHLVRGPAFHVASYHARIERDISRGLNKLRHERRELGEHARATCGLARLLDY